MVIVVKVRLNPRDSRIFAKGLRTYAIKAEIITIFTILGIRDKNARIAAKAIRSPIPLKIFPVLLPDSFMDFVIGHVVLDKSMRSAVHWYS
jgi:hypothetical protein